MRVRMSDKSPGLSLAAQPALLANRVRATRSAKDMVFHPPRGAQVTTSIGLPSQVGEGERYNIGQQAYPVKDRLAGQCARVLPDDANC